MGDQAKTFVRVEREGNLVELLLDRAEALNAINSALADQLLAACISLASDRQAWVIILRAAGERAFSAGADLKERQTFDAAQWIVQRDLFRRMFQSVRALPQPTIAAVQGFALGGGAELALLCDCVVAADNAQFGFPEARLGIIPGGNGVLNLPRIVGPGRAKEIMFSGRRILAQEAAALGLIQRLVSPPRLVEESRALAAAFLACSPTSLRAIKELANASLDLTRSDALDLEEQRYQSVIASQDRVEGISAFNEGRASRWRGP